MEKNAMLTRYLFIVFGMEHYNPLGIIRTLGQCGIVPVFIAIKGKRPVSSKSRYIKKSHFVDTVKEGYKVLIREYGNENPKPFVIVSDDNIQSFLDLNYENLKDKFIVFHAGKNGRVTEYMNKKVILDLAQKHKLEVLHTIVVDKGVLPEDIEYPIITKSISPNVGGWKSDVHICNSREELMKAYEHILSPRVLIQKFIDKKNEYCLEGFSIAKGRKLFIPIATTYNYLIRGYYSPYTTVHPFEDKSIEDSLNAMFEEIGFEGIFEVEFLIGQDGKYYFSEVNFRNSPWSYTATLLGMPLPVLWAEAMLSGKVKKEWYKPIPPGYTAMVEPIDYKKRVQSGLIDSAQWLMEFKNTDCLFYLDADDPEPFREMVNNWEELG